MKFNPIKTLPAACPLFVEDAYNALVNKLGVTAWRWHEPVMASELERFLLYGGSRKKHADFFEIYGNHEYSKFAVFDHAICFKGITGIPFVLTMPYGTPDWFYQNFKLFSNEYYREKTSLVDSLGVGYKKAHRTQDWMFQFGTHRKLTATIVPDIFKIRKNGDFAAIIATDSNMQYLSEHGGFPLVNANGDER